MEPRLEKIGRSQGKILENTGGFAADDAKRRHSNQARLELPESMDRTQIKIMH